MSVTKKFLSIILAILMIVSSVPFALAGGGGLILTINMYDNGGDGWEGAKINIYSNEDGVLTEVDSATFDDGEEATYTTEVPYGNIYVFTWSKGSSDEECFFKIKIGSASFRASSSECDSFEQDEQIYSTFTCEEHTDYENGKCVVCKYALPFEVTTGETVAYYSSFEDALNNAQDGSTVKLMRDIDDDGYKTIDKAITLDLNGYEWVQPSSDDIDVFANVTFTDSFGGGFCWYELRLNCPVTFIGGSYYFVGIRFETEDKLADYLGTCSEYYDYWTDELLDLSDATNSGGRVKIVLEHTGGTQTCKGYKCDECYEWYGKADATAHSFVGGICEFCSEAEVNKPATDSTTETVTPDGSAADSDVCDVCGEEHTSFFNDIICAIKRFFNMIVEFFKGLNS